MEGSKNAMYAQAGRNHGWTQGMREITPAPAAVPAPVAPAPVIPEPPVVVMPVRPVIEAPIAEVPMFHAAGQSSVMMSAEVSIDIEQSAMPTPVPALPAEPMHVFKGCETPVMAYIPAQRWGDLYEPEQGFSRGTMFMKLDLPFIGEGACRHE